jgi:hypothetical protein
MRRLNVNITRPERIGRIAIGLVAVVGGMLLVASSTAALTTVLELLLILAGLDLIATGALGHCPLYQKLGFVPRSLKRSS